MKNLKRREGRREREGEGSEIQRKGAAQYSISLLSRAFAFLPFYTTKQDPRLPRCCLRYPSLPHSIFDTPSRAVSGWFVADMNGTGGSFLAVRRISQGIGRNSAFHSSSADIVAGTATWIGRGFSCVCVQRRDSDARISFNLSPSQEICLIRLQKRIEVPYNVEKIEHQEALRTLWCVAFPGVELHSLISEQWKEMGWQGKDPSTDFRGGGFISLENLLFFAKTFPKSFQELLRKQEGERAIWEYPFAVAGVNITFMLIQMLDLQSVKPRTILGAIFLKLLSEDENAFDLLFCITFKLMDHQWLALHATYMDFNMVMKSTRRQLERELLLEDIQRVEDMPSYRLLKQ